MSLKEQILSNMPNNLTDLEKARYIYIELGKKLSFSTKFQNTDEASFALMFFETVDIDTFDKNQVNCIMWAKLYSQLLDAVNIKNTVVNMGHRFVVFEIDGIKWKADATKEDCYTDLSRIHNYDETVMFGPLAYQNIELEKINPILLNDEVINTINNIDNKLGYNCSNKKKLQELKEILQNIKKGNINIRELVSDTEITNENELFIKLEYLFCKLDILNSGYYESKDFVRFLEQELLTKEELSKVKAIELKRTNHNKEVDIIQCIYVTNGNTINYYLLTPNYPIRKVESVEITKLAMLGFGIGDKQIPGVVFPNKFKVGRVSMGLRYKIERNFVPKELRIYDEKQCKSVL